MIPLHQFVGFEKSTLDEIFSKTPISKGFEFISIDIDGRDYNLWESLVNHHTKVVCLKFNPTIATGGRDLEGGGGEARCALSADGDPLQSPPFASSDAQW